MGEASFTGRANLWFDAFSSREPVSTSLENAINAKKEKAVRAGTERLNFRNCRFATGSAAEFRRGL